MNPPVAIVLAQHASGRVLAVERSGGGWALPGGQIEEGESSSHAAFRELREETGYEAVRLIPLFAAFYRRRAVYVFMATALTGELRSSAEGEARWVNEVDVILGPFGDLFVETLKRAARSRCAA